MDERIILLRPPVRHSEFRVISSKSELTVANISAMLMISIRRDPPGKGYTMVRPFRTLVLMFLLAMGIPAPGSSSASPPPPDELVSLATSAGKPVIADFGLGFCMQCREQSKTLERIRRTYGAKVAVRMVNVGKEQALTSRYEVELIPTLVFFDAAGKAVLKKVGPMKYDAIRDQLSRMGVK